MLLYPKIYLDSVTDISLDLLEKNNIKALILDIDNTLIDYDKNMSRSIVEWCNNLKRNGIKLIILSNTNKTGKVRNVAKVLGIGYIYRANKPFKRGFKKSRKRLDLPAENIAVVGDQIFTDVLGANRSNMFSILVKPIDERDIMITKIKRPLERLIIKKYTKNNYNRTSEA